MPSSASLSDDAGALNPDWVIPVLVAGMVATGATVVVTNGLDDPANETDVENAASEAGQAGDGSELLSNTSPNVSVEEAANATRNRTDDATNVSVNASTNGSTNTSLRNGTVGNRTENVTEAAENATATNATDANVTSDVDVFDGGWSRFGAFEELNGTQIEDSVVGPSGETLYLTGYGRAGPSTEGYAEDTTVGVLAALSTENGSLRWTLVSDGPHEAEAVFKGVDLAPSRDLVVVAGSAFKGDQDNLAEPGERDDLLVLAVNTTTGEEAWHGTYEPQRTDFARANDVVVTPDDRWVVAAGAGDGGQITTLVNTSTGQARWTDVAGRTSGSGYSLAHAIATGPDGQAVYVTGRYLDAEEGSPHLGTTAYSVPDGDRLWLAKYDRGERTTERGLDVAAGPTGERVAVVGTSDQDGATVVYNAMTGDQMWVGPWAGEADRSDDPESVAFGPSGERVYVGGTIDDGPATPNGTTRAYHAGNGSLAWESKDPTWVSDVVAGPDGRSVYALGGSLGDGPRRSEVIVLAYEARTGQETGWASPNGSDRNETRIHEDLLAIPPTGDRVLVGGDFMEHGRRSGLFAAGFDLPLLGPEADDA